MQILLKDVDSKIPNLALMKISAYHKAQGDEVGFNIPDPELIYASIIFEKNKHKADGLKFFYPDAQIIIGGPGYSLLSKLPAEIEYLKPDYSIYPECDYILGFSTRGCNRECSFCIVPKKEGCFKIVQHPEYWHNSDFGKIVFLDNNILFNKNWFLQVADWCINNNLKVWFMQGLDIRLMDKEVAEKLLELTYFKGLFFAWDNLKDEKQIKDKIQLLKDVGFTNGKLKSDVHFYVYVDSNIEYGSGVHRCRELKKLSCNAFVMFNVKHKPNSKINKLRRWSILPRIFWKIDISEYDRSKKKRTPAAAAGGD